VNAIRAGQLLADPNFRDYVTTQTASPAERARSLTATPPRYEFLSRDELLQEALAGAHARLALPRRARRTENGADACD
jgi:hypothetical protein